MTYIVDKHEWGISIIDIISNQNLDGMRWKLNTEAVHAKTGGKGRIQEPIA